MAENSGTRAVDDTESRSAAGASKQVHHGRTAAAWAGSMLAMVAFVLGGIAVIMQNWVLFGVAVVIIIGALVATKVLQAMGHGAD
jgi:hypothetical protein